MDLFQREFVYLDMEPLRWILPAILLCAPAFCQKAPGPEFEVASIRPSGTPDGGQVSVGLHVDGAQLRCTYLALKDYIRIAYRLRDYQVTGPDWLASERFDISAKMPASARRDQVPEMLQTLLTDRFQIKMHRDKKDFPVYALVVGKGGLKISEWKPEGGVETQPAAQGSVGDVNVAVVGGPGGVNMDLGRGSTFGFSNNRLEGKKLTMNSFTDLLARFVDRPVIDMTDLPGRYDFTLQLAPEDYTAMLVRSAINAGVALPPQAMRALEVSSGDSLFAAVEKLGLKLDARKAPLDVLIVDQANKLPTEN